MQQVEQQMEKMLSGSDGWAEQQSIHPYFSAAGKLGEEKIMALWQRHSQRLVYQCTHISGYMFTLYVLHVMFHAICNMQYLICDTVCNIVVYLYVFSLRAYAFVCMPMHMCNYVHAFASVLVSVYFMWTSLGMDM